MLETLRRNSRNLIIYLIFGILIAVFIISFGPQAGQGGGSQCMPSSSWVAKVGSQEISETSWRFALLSTREGASSGARARASRVRERVMDELIKRELLAQAAEDAGFRLSDTEVEKRIADGEMYIMGLPYQGQGAYFRGDVFDYELLEAFVKNRGLPSVNHFIEEQRREMLAEKMKELLRASVRVSPEEVLAAYKQHNTKVSVEYVKFEPYKYAREVDLGAAEIDTFVGGREEDIKKKYEATKNSYLGLPKQVKVRQIFIRAAAKDPGATPAEPAADAARAKADDALRRLKAGEDFAKVSREVSDDRRGAIAVWRSIASLGAQELRQAVEKLESGAMTDVVATPQGFYIVKVEGKREKDQKYEDVRRDIAEELLREEKARALALADAQEALKKAQGGVALEQQFERLKPVDEPMPTPIPLPVEEEKEPAPPPSPEPSPGSTGTAPESENPTPRSPTNPPSTPAKSDTKTPEGTPKPASPVKKEPASPTPKAPPSPSPSPEHGYWDDEGYWVVRAENGEGSDQPPPKPGVPEAKPPVSPKPAPGPAGGSPKLAEQDRPKLMSSDELVRSGTKLPGLGDSKELAKALFEELKPGDLGGKVFEVAPFEGKVDYVVVRLISRKDWSRDEFEKEKEALAADFALVKAYRVLEDWTSRRCREVLEGGEIAVNSNYVDYNEVDEKTGQPKRTSYTPCAPAPEMMPGLPPGITFGQ